MLVATGLYSPDIGGPATYTSMLEDKLQNCGIDLTVLPFGTVRHLPKVVRHFVFMYRLWELAKKTDIIYALDSISVGVPAYIVSVLTHKPFIVRLGGDYAWEQGRQRFGLEASLDEYTAQKKQAPLLVRVFAGIQSYVVKRAVRVVAPSEYLKGIIATWGVAESKIEVIYSALFPLEVTESKAILREQLSYTGTVITTVGRLVPWKGFLELVDVFAELHEENPDTTLVIIGDGPLQEELVEKIHTLELTDSIRLQGRVGKQTLAAAIKGSDLFVLNTSYEGLSHQLLEVMDLGVPIVTTNVGGNPELITDGVSGLLVPPLDNQELKSAIKRLLENESLRVRLTQSARVRIQAFNPDVVVKELIALVGEICLRHTK